MATVGDNIRNRRIELGMTQKELATRCGYTSSQAITRIESGENNIPIPKVSIFANALDTTVEYILSGVFEDAENDVLLDIASKVPSEKRSLAIKLLRSLVED